MANHKHKPNPHRYILEVEAGKILDAPGPTTWRKLLGGDAGHVRTLGNQLLQNERNFRAAVSIWYRGLAKSIVAAIRAGDEPEVGVTDRHRQDLKRIVEQYVQRSAAFAAGIEWAMHQRHPSAKACVAYVQKGVWQFVRSLPDRLLTMVKAVVAGVMIAFNPDAMIDPITQRASVAVARAIDAAPNQRYNASVIAAKVHDEVFSRARIAAVASGIAVTQNAAAANAGSAAAGKVLKEYGLVNAKRWMTLHGTGKIDDRVRPTHVEANGQTVGVDDQFVLHKPGKAGGVETCDRPGDPELSAGNSRYCRCLEIFLWVGEK